MKSYPFLELHLAKAKLLQMKCKRNDRNLGSNDFRISTKGSLSFLCKVIENCMNRKNNKTKRFPVKNRLYSTRKDNCFS